MNDSPDEGLAGIGVTKYRSYTRMQIFQYLLFLLVACSCRAECGKLGVSGNGASSNPAKWIGVDEALQSSAQQRDARKIATQAS